MLSHDVTFKFIAHLERVALGTRMKVRTPDEELQVILFGSQPDEGRLLRTRVEVRVVSRVQAARLNLRR